MPDAWETAQGLNPGDPDDAWRDPDGDGVVNLFEYQLGSDPRSPATPLVKTVGPTGANYTSVATALNAVARGTLLRVAGGSYLVNYTNFSAKVVMIQGGWSPDFRQRDLRLYPTEFDGALRGEILYFSPGSGESAIVLDGLRFVRGNGFFGAVNLLAQGSSVMRTSILSCSIAGSFAGGADSVLNMNNWSTSASDRTIVNTVIGGNQGGAIKSQNTESSVARWRLINTTISRNAVFGRDTGYGVRAFTLDTGRLTVHLYNSILWGNALNDIDISRNIAFDADHADVGRVSAVFGATVRPGAGVVNIDPQFVNAGNGDFHLASSSPVIDGGVNRGLPSTDFEGDPRIVGALADMGADEQLQGGARTPGAPTGLTASASGSNIALAWTAPAVGSSTTSDDLDVTTGDETTGGAPTAYTIEAGSSSGLANLANFSTGNTATTFAAGGIGNGTYYLRVRATNSFGTSAASNEATLVVGGGGCSVAPGAPGSLTITQNSGGNVAFRWTAAAGGPTTYVLEAGSAPGLANLANVDLGGTGTTFATSGVGAGTYYVRVKAANACGTSAPSNDVVLIVP